MFRQIILGYYREEQVRLVKFRLCQVITVQLRLYLVRSGCLRFGLFRLCLVMSR
jgi:hypothetical protein